MYSVTFLKEKLDKPRRDEASGTGDAYLVSHVFDRMTGVKRRHLVFI